MALNLGKVFKKHGIAISEQKTKLWSTPEMIAENLKSKDFEVYVKTHTGTGANKVELDMPYMFIVVQVEEGSRAVSFAPGQVDPEDFTWDSNTGIVKDFDDEINIGIVTALRDDEDLTMYDLNNDKVEVEKGVQTLKAYVA